VYVVLIKKRVYLSCPFYGAFWPLVWDWLGIEGVEDQAISDHVQQFIHYAGVSKSRRSFFHLIWLLCVWVLWKDRNDRLFRNTHSSLQQLLDKVKHYSLWWSGAEAGRALCGHLPPQTSVKKK